MVDDRHDPGLEARLEATEIGIAREDDVLRGHHPPRGGHLGRTTPPDPLDARAFEDPGAGGGRGRGHPEHEAKGMEVPAARVHSPPDVAVARDLLAHLRAGQHPVSVIAEAPVAELRLGLDPPHVARAGGREQVARSPVALDSVAGDALGDDRLRLLRERPQALRARRAEGPFEVVHRLAHAAPDLPAVASARPPAHPLRLEHDDRVPPLREVQGGGDPGEPGADDAHVRPLASGERGPGSDRGRGGGVVGTGSPGTRTWRDHRSTSPPA